MAAIHRVLGEQDVLPWELLTSHPLLGWLDGGSRHDDPMSFANEQIRDIKTAGYCDAREWVDTLVRFLLSEHVPADWAKTFHVRSCVATLKYWPHEEMGAIEPTLTLSVLVAMDAANTHHLNVEMSKQPTRYFGKYKPDHPEWLMVASRHHWAWGTWATMSEQALANGADHNPLNIEVRESDGCHFFERNYGKWMCLGMPDRHPAVLDLGV